LEQLKQDIKIKEAAATETKLEQTNHEVSQIASRFNQNNLNRCIQINKLKS